MTDELRKSVEQTITNCLQNKLLNYSPESKYMPFHHRLLGKDRMALFSFIHSLNTSFGTSIFEPVAVSLASDRFVSAERQKTVGTEIYVNTQAEITNIVNTLRTDAKAAPDKTKELTALSKTLSGAKSEVNFTKADLYLVDKQGEIWAFDLKSPKPNKGEFQGFKQTLLEWAGSAMPGNKDAKIHTLLAIPYNPYYPEPYERWTMKGLFDLPNEIMVAEEFWDFLGGKGSYEELLGCFERVGIEMRAKIDEYFKRFQK
jgi:type II restriction enzyme